MGTFSIMILFAQENYYCIKKEILKMQLKIKQEGFTLIPTKLYFNEKGKVKVEIALAKGKKLYDKRETIKQREQKRELQKNYKQF